MKEKSHGIRSARNLPEENGFWAWKLQLEITNRKQFSIAPCDFGGGVGKRTVLGVGSGSALCRAPSETSFGGQEPPTGGGEQIIGGGGGAKNFLGEAFSSSPEFASLFVAL